MKEKACTSKSTYQASKLPPSARTRFQRARLRGDKVLANGGLGQTTA